MYLDVGKIINTFGIKGELKVVSDSEFIEDRLAVGNSIYLGDSYQEFKITSLRFHKNNYLISLEGFNNINDVLIYVGEIVYVLKDEIRDLDDGFYLFQLKNLDVYEDKRLIGKVIDIEKNYQTLLKVKVGERLVLIPFVPAFIKEVDLKKKMIKVKLIEGLI